jgi:TonB family protein
MFKSIFLIAQIVGVIAGKVVNSTTGEGIPSASVFVEGTTLGASTDKNGIYFIKDVPVGRYTLIATAVGFEVVKLSVVVMPDEVAIVNFNLTPKTDERVRETAFGERYFDIVEEMPEIIGGLESIQRNLVYPETAIRAGVQGTVLVMAFVDENGNVERAEVVRGIGAGCDEAAVSAVMKVKFKPGKLNGKPVKARVLIPINFKLRAKQIQEAEQIQKALTLLLLIFTLTVSILYAINATKKLLNFIILLFALNFSYSQRETIFHDFTLDDFAGVKYKFSSFFDSGKVVMLSFWASWCEPCLKELVELKDIYDKYYELGLRIITVNIDTRNNLIKAKRFALQNKLKYIMLYDVYGEVKKLYGIESIPQLFIFDDKKQLRYHHTGFKDIEIIENEIKEIISQTK